MGAAGRDFPQLQRRLSDDLLRGGRRVHGDADPVHQRPEDPAELSGVGTRTGSRSTTRASWIASLRNCGSTRSCSVLGPSPRVRHASGVSAMAAGASFVPRAGRDDARGAGPVVARRARCERGRARARPPGRSCRRSGRGEDLGRRSPPMPYGDLGRSALQRFASFDDLDRGNVTIEERESTSRTCAGDRRLRGRGTTARSRAGPEGVRRPHLDGGNTHPFYRPIRGTSSSRIRCARGTSRATSPARRTFRMADVIVINKIDSADARAGAGDRGAAAELNRRR